MAIDRLPAPGAGIPTTTVTAKGDLIVGTANNAVSRLGVGTNGFTIVADSAEATGIKWAAPAAAGKVLQVVSTTYSTTTTIATNTFTDTGLSLSITPSATTSKILAIVSQPITIDRNSSVGIYADFRLVRGSTSIYDVGNTLTLFAAQGNTFNLTIGVVMAISYLDSPSTTSATTYKTQSKTAVANTTVTLQNGSYPASLILMEIGA